MSPSRRPSAKRVALEASGHLDRAEAWNGLRAGDPVIVAGLHLRGATWEFRAYIRNQHNGTESVEVIGGRPGDRKIRSFGPERIFAVNGTTRTSGRADRAIAGQLSLADAPQLPLD
jgi:hypothetical protein